MKSRDAKKLLQISQPTLQRWIDAGKLKSIKLPNGRRDIDPESVYAILNKGVPRKTLLYARVSTQKQKADLSNQMEKLRQFSAANGWKISGEYEDVASGISFEKRKQFFNLLDEVIDYKVERVVITYKDRLSRAGFELFEHLFAHYNTEIVVMSDCTDKKTNEQEIFEEIISLLRAFSMPMDSGRRKQLRKVVKGIEEDEENSEAAGTKEAEADGNVTEETSGRGIEEKL